MELFVLTCLMVLCAVVAMAPRSMGGEPRLPAGDVLRELCWKHRLLARVGYLAVRLGDVDEVGTVVVAVRERRHGETTVVCAGVVLEQAAVETEREV